jgi:hypothetical protein
MIRPSRGAGWLYGLLVIAASSAAACQNPNDPTDTVNYSEAVDISASPDPIGADASTGGKTYRVVRGNNQPDEFLAYDWHAVFSSTLTMNSKATDESLDLDFPVRITGVTATVSQATGGIITPPTGTETEKFEYVTLSATGNPFGGVGSPVNMSFEVWYDLPNLRKESIIKLTWAFVDNDGTSFQIAKEFQVGP